MNDKKFTYDDIVNRMKEEPVLRNPEELTLQIIAKLPPRKKRGNIALITGMISGIAASLLVGLFISEISVDSYKKTEPMPINLTIISKNYTPENISSIILRKQKNKEIKEKFISQITNYEKSFKLFNNVK